MFAGIIKIIEPIDEDFFIDECKLIIIDFMRKFFSE